MRKSGFLYYLLLSPLHAPPQTALVMLLFLRVSEQQYVHSVLELESHRCSKFCICMDLLSISVSFTLLPTLGFWKFIISSLLKEILMRMKVPEVLFVGKYIPPPV